MSPKAEPQAHILESYANASHLNWGVLVAQNPRRFCSAKSFTCSGEFPGFRCPETIDSGQNDLIGAYLITES